MDGSPPDIHVNVGGCDNTDIVRATRHEATRLLVDEVACIAEREGFIDRAGDVTVDGRQVLVRGGLYE
jgi:post-segregation antitoxin (ccd killing protein)